MVPVLHAWVKSQRGKKTLLTLGSLWASMLPSISLHSASNLCTCKKKKIWNHGKVCYCQFQLNDHLKLFLSITHFLWHLIFIYKLFNNSDNKIGVRILGCYHKKEFFIFKTFDYHYTFSSSFKWKVKRNFLARWKTSVAAERQKYLLITYFKKVAKNSLVLNINSLVQPHHCNPHPEKCPIILKKLWLHDMTNKDTITTTKPPRKPLVVAFWACFLQKKSTTNLV